MLTSPIWQQALWEIRTIPRKVFKERSNCGFVWLDRRWNDLGNRCYCCLWQLFWHVSSHNPHIAAMRALANTYESLGDRWPWSDDSEELKGDVIEYSLSITVATGPAVPLIIRTERLELQAHFRKFQDLWIKVMKIIANHLGRGYPPNRMLPKPRNLAKLIALSCVVDACPPHGIDDAFRAYACD